jgi:hypothetical protein
MASRRRKIIFATCGLVAVACAVYAVMPHEKEDHAFLRSLGPTAISRYPDDPGNGGFSTIGYNFPADRFEEVSGAIGRHLSGRNDCIHEKNDSGEITDEAWHNASDTWGFMIDNGANADSEVPEQTRVKRGCFVTLTWRWGAFESVYNRVLWALRLAARQPQKLR